VTDCLFCEIIAGTRPAHIVLSDEIAVAFLDIRPVFKGHVLVATREHYVTLPDLPPGLVGPLFTRVQAVSAAIGPALGAQGSFVALNNIVSQSVPHLHVHVVRGPRGTACAVSSGADRVRQRRRGGQLRPEVSDAIGRGPGGAGLTSDSGQVRISR
jgi:histidine triad (HIT) family protein